MVPDPKTNTSATLHPDGNSPAAPPYPRCRTITLTDEPEEIDAFSDGPHSLKGPHDRIADALAELIQPADAKGISIGIEGNWGSGKSTVARLLTKKLKDDDNIAVVSFDAWAHEGDPLRRTFLEKIIEKLQDLGWVEQEKWDNPIEEFANRREVVKTKDSLTITRSGRVIALLLLLIPIGSAFVNAALDEDITLDASRPIALKFFIFFAIGLLLTFTPVAVLLLRIKRDPDVLGLLFGKNPTEKTTETNKTVNPTSIEFEEGFQELFEDALKDERRRVVLILDNLDRVDSKDALTIWSTLQTFLQHKGTARRGWHERLWLLVLYDFRGLSQLWENTETKENSGNKDDTKNKSKAETALSFIDKSFQIRFEVPALVPSDWDQFLKDQLEKAFPDHTDTDRHEVYRVFAIGVGQGARPPTIRELKLFVNQVGSIHRQWAAGGARPADTFPLGHIACYVLLRRDQDVIAELFNPGFPAKEYQDLLGSTIRDNLAGLAFNVETHLAQQLLFSDKIKSALIQGSADELKNIDLLLGRGFFATFDRIATTQWAEGEATTMADAARALDESELLTKASKPSAQSIMRSIVAGATKAIIWSPMDQDKAKGLRSCPTYRSGPILMRVQEKH